MPATLLLRVLMTAKEYPQLYTNNGTRKAPLQGGSLSNIVHEQIQGAVNTLET